MFGKKTQEQTPKRGGMGSLLAGLRLILDNPVTKLAFRLASRDVVCFYEAVDTGVKHSIVYHALSKLAGLKVSCPFPARFLIFLIERLVAFGVRLLNGDLDEVKQALTDPAVRRGVELVLKGLGLYGVTVPQKLPAPFLIVWNFTNMCNMRCMHCYQNASRPSPDELSLEEKLKLVDELDKAGVAAVAFSGGEPTIHPHFYIVLKEVASRGMYAAVATNGWVFADIEKLRKAKDLGLRYVEVSIDSANPLKHDRFRGVNGAWNRAVKALENAVKLGISNAMAITVTKLNIDEVDDILDLAESIGVQRVVFFNFIPVGRGKNNIWLDLTPEEREEFLKTIFRKRGKYKFEILSTAPQYARIALQLSGGKEVSPSHFYVSGDPIVKSVAEYVGGCGAGRIYAAIDPNGDVKPCVFMPIVVGNIRRKGFQEIWATSSIFKLLRDRSKLRGYCGVCPYRNVCGGCRARAYAYFNDVLAPDPGCIYNRNYWAQLVGRKVESKTGAATTFSF